MAKLSILFILNGLLYCLLLVLGSTNDVSLNINFLDVPLITLSGNSVEIINVYNKLRLYQINLHRANDYNLRIRSQSI